MSKRKLRSDTAAGGVDEGVLEDTTIAAPRAKKAKKDVVRYLCYICDRERSAGAFPDYNPSSECEHNINTCKSCLKLWVDVSLEGAQTTISEDRKVFGLKCPECEGIMKNVNIQIATTKKMHGMFEKMERKHIADNTPGWRWCMAPNCNAGQVHEPKIIDKPKEPPKSKSRSKKKAVDPETDVEDIFTCNECGARACVTCDRPYHEGETCAAYQLRIRDRTVEEDKSLLEIERVTRKCPSCKGSIQKNGGCNTMFCFACKVLFCWNCVSPFEQGAYCKCNPRPPQ